MIRLEPRNALVFSMTFLYEGAAIDVENPTFVVYDSTKTAIATITEGITRGDNNEYLFVYDISFFKDRRRYYVEAHGTYQGHPISEKTTFEVKFDV